MVRSTATAHGHRRSNRSVQGSRFITQPTRSRTRVALLLASVALIGASCDSGGADDVVAATTATTAAPSTTASAAATTTAAGPTTTTMEEPSLAWRSVELVDASRPSGEILDADGNVTFEGSDSRSIPTVILYPGTDGGGPDVPVADTPPRPLAIYLKGFGGLNGPTDPLLVKLAEAGYIVAAPNIREVSEPVNYLPGYVEQPGDARFVIDALTDPDDGFVDDLAPLIDPMRIGLVGHSIGNTAAFGLAFHDCCRDDRVDAVVAFGANPNRGLDESDFEFAGTPLLLIYGSNDEIAPAELGTGILDVAQPPSHLLILPGADHFQPVYGDGDGDRSATTAATVGVGFLDLQVAGTSTQEDFNDLTASLESGTWQNAGA